METKEEAIKKIYRLNDELQVLLNQESDLYKAATNNRENKITIKRDGKDVEVTEGELWEEIRYVAQMGGVAKQATDLMKKKYPEAFEAAEARDAKNDEIKAAVYELSGMNLPEIHIAGVMKLVEAIVDYKLGEKLK